MDVIALCEYENSITRILSYLEHYPAHMELLALLSTIYAEIGDNKLAKYYYIQSLIQTTVAVPVPVPVHSSNHFHIHVPFANISAEAWNLVNTDSKEEFIDMEHKGGDPLLNNRSITKRKVHYVTVASDNNEQLSLLMRSAEISGIAITVLGLNQGYRNLGQKGMFEWVGYALECIRYNIII